jgi:hypothetical protein
LWPWASAAPARRERTVLAEGWRVRELSSPEIDIAALARSLAAPGGEWMETPVPAEVHDVLLRYKRIPDPRFGDNVTKVRWVTDRDWAYGCTFRSPAGGGPVFLEFQGLDTLAMAYVNGVEIGRFENMYRQYRVEVRRHLAPAGAQNTLLIVFRSVTKYLERFEPPAAHAGRIPKTRYLRKAPPDFTSYLGARPDLVKVGVFRDVILDVPGPAWIDDVWVRTEVAGDHTRATLRARVEISGGAANLDWRLMDPSGTQIAAGTAPAGKEFALPVSRPKLWWPRPYGTPNLYRLAIRLESGGATADSREVRIGFRDVKPIMSDASTGEKRFRFDVNGLPVYFRGACWAPIEHISHCWLPERSRRLFALAENARMNIFRIWGESTEPPQEFYDECDRLGIMVWQDFFFANGMEPSDLPEWAANAKSEVEEMVRRLRNHPSLLLWSGGNENFMSVDFARQQFTLGSDLFLKTMPEITGRLDLGRLFHPSSPYGGRVPNWPLEGDWHDYTTIQFAPEASVPLWTSEVLRASPPSLASMKQFLPAEDLWPAGWSTAVRKPGAPAWPPAWTYHSTGVATWDRAGAIERYVDADSAAGLIRNLATAHGDYLQERVERQRRGVPDGAPDGNRRNWGNTIWRFNDPWPMIYSSVVDYYLEPKIAYYSLRRAYEAVLVSFERTPDWIAVWVTNDSPAAARGTLEVEHLRFDGKSLGKRSAAVSLEPGQSKRVLKMTDFGVLSLREEFLRAAFGQSEATLLLAAERYLHLPEARLKASRSGDEILISTDAFARQVTLEFEGALGQAFDDNYFDLAPGHSRRVRVLEPGGGKALSVRALNAAPVAVQ